MAGQFLLCDCLGGRQRTEFDRLCLESPFPFSMLCRAFHSQSHPKLRT
jgi:hypothetical protein